MSSHLSRNVHVSILWAVDGPSLIAYESTTPPFQALYSTYFVDDKPILVRDFIHSALYHPKHGYFSQRSKSVGVLEKSIKFNQLEEVQDLCIYLGLIPFLWSTSKVTSWFTPVELFKPWYAHGIAEAILRTANLSVPLKLSGNQSSLAEIQKETVGEVRSHLSKFKVECRDAADRGGWGMGMWSNSHVWVIMLEVLDNLPHDLIYSENQVLPWKEVWIEKQPDRKTLSELYKPLQDPLIKCCVEIMELDSNQSVSKARSIWSKVFPKPRRCWLPTSCLKLLQVLHEALPKMSLIASDFSYLPDVSIPGERAPLVSTKKDGRSSDYKSYLEAKGDADIFFPTDFWLLERMDHYCSGWLKMHQDKSSKQGKKRRTLVLDTSSFMEEFGLPSKTRTKDGYNPLLDDFKNTKFYLSVPTHNRK
ncbi:hypothetical protein GH714_022524 [Hevea brasiliensis]|uniref:Protein arginine methyltransferase NDUFAF7 n=1 Tax=Hevea brasiliensis TaxID=3981 RepID=A0A6A6KLS1_HEVBR|nr:hypothetical protein GH714_022524 [Hevea brasiliensis]